MRLPSRPSIVVAAAFLLGGAAPNLAAQDTPEAGARAVLDSLMAAESIPGMAVAVAVDGDVIWSEGLGWADVDAERPITTETLFRVGSVSKSFTAVGLGVLMDAAAIDLDAPVQVYVPSFPRKRWPVTTRQLGGHLAGVRHYRGNEFLSAVHYPDVSSGLGIFAADSLLFEPGTAYSYSSYGWNLLSAVMEAASGEPFLAFMEDRVFERLGMSHTVPDDATAMIPDRTTFYELDDSGRVAVAPYVDNSYKWAGGGFLSTPEDLVRFSRSVVAPGFLSAPTLSVLLTSQRLASGEETGYGIGWRDGRTDEGHRTASHTGGSVGGTTILWIDLETDVVVALVANRGDAPITGSALVERLAGFFAPAMAGF